MSFGDDVITQTTLASMFPISYGILISSFMSTSLTPSPTSPLSPNQVRALTIADVSLTYSGHIKSSDLNTELLFLARAYCSFGTPLVNITFSNDVVIIDDENNFTITFQGLILSGDLTFSENSVISDGGSLQIGVCNIGGNLNLGTSSPISSLELYSSSISGDIILPTLNSIFIFGLYPQLSLSQFSGMKSLVYLNSSDGKGPRDVPRGSTGFGAYTLSGLTKTSYPDISVLGLAFWPTKDQYELVEALFPNLSDLYLAGGINSSSVIIPLSAKSRYNSLNIIGSPDIRNLDVSERIGYLTENVRIVGCPQLMSVFLTSKSDTLWQTRKLSVEFCALVFLRGTEGLTNSPGVLRLGDHVSPIASVFQNKRLPRLLDYIVINPPFVTSDYLPNVLTALAERFPQLVLYPVMQTVVYNFIQSPSPQITQYNGGTNPVIPYPVGSSLAGANITVSPFGIRYMLKISPDNVVVSSSLFTNTKDEHHSSVKNLTLWILVGVSLLVLIIGIVILVIKKKSNAGKT